MWIFYVLPIPLVVFLILFFSTTPGRQRNRAPFDNTLYAHRGLHSGDSRVPENSLAAFAAAAQAGYGVELDIQLTADRQVVVFHDDDLKRMCGVDKRVSELTYAELRALHLLDSDQYIPLLTEVLDTLNGTTLLCEFKTAPVYTDVSLCELAVPILDGYKGTVCMESFNPFLVRWFSKNAPQYIRGILSKRYVGNEVRPILRFLLSSLQANWFCRPDFISYQCKDYKQPFFRLSRVFRPMTVGWTVTSPEEEKAAAKHFDTLIFEGYLPAKK